MISDPNRPISLTRHPTRVQALFEGHLLADSGDVLVVREADADPVFYFPRKDIEMAVLQASDRPVGSGEAGYFTIMRDRKFVENVAWSYETPPTGRSALAGRIAFDPKHVELHITETPADTARESASYVDDVVRHTDSGAGFSQEAAWEPTVSEPAQPDPDKPYSGVGSI